ncbi:hypothetical protein Q2K19_24220 [Micromonospora soli]|nr:hypothetical protein [Micromonospora sp. NBRC 110009]WKT97257.1 hypothetical protein Q2K19_24220 [Micromonospora sp. NBRC 110009]
MTGCTSAMLTPGFTRRVYPHLLPSSEDRTRRAIDAAFQLR